MRRLLAFAAATETLTGLCLIALPSLFVRLLFAAEIAGAGLAAARVAGIALMALGVACWPGREVRSALVAMLGYNLLLAAYFVTIGVSGEPVGVLFWPVTVFHAALVAPLFLALRNVRSGTLSNAV